MNTELRNKLFSTWRKLKDRCNNPKHKEYNTYGGLGIHYDPRWDSFELFLHDIELLPGWNASKVLSGELQLDKDYRFIGNKYYSKDTCIWISRKYNMLYQPSRKSSIYAYNPELDKLECYLSPAWFGEVNGVDSGTCSSYSLGGKRELKGYYLWRTNALPPLMYFYVGVNTKTGERIIKNKVTPICEHFGITRRSASRSIFANKGMTNPTHSTKGIIVFKEYMSINAQRLSKVDTSFKDLWSKLVE